MKNHQPSILYVLQQETDAWKRTLDYMRDENIQLKTRLSQVLQQHSSKQLLETAEYYNTLFLNEDEILKLLRKDIIELDTMLLTPVIENENMLQNICKRHAHLRNDVEIAEKAFKNIKYQFHQDLAAVLN